jgi:hypothetical protein
LNVLTAATTCCSTGIETGGDHQITLRKKICTGLFMPLHNIISLDFYFADYHVLLVRHYTGKALSAALRVMISISLLIL